VTVEVVALFAVDLVTDARGSIGVSSVAVRFDSSAR